LSEKYDITRHPNYRFLSDTDSKLAFIFRKEVDKNMKLETDRVSEIYNMGFVSSDA
jgi:type IV secretion system protein VirD4